ncbi:hypothetical protein LWM68_45485 [Niabella sp. W65]|nr:hypothetical protein [Niabella sp. W65]MCH7369354.1 hypothetical protein [Niabella sp. W65]ULT44894.1 hypothetical protein KRR40_17195 [Niabella sp. I65]
MQKQHHVSPGYWLNRIAVHYNSDPFKANPVKVLQAFFDYAGRAEQIKAFDDFCRAALKDSYSWQHGSPANALHYGEQLELLIEACYLLHQQAGQLPSKPLVAVPVTELPMLLTSKEFSNPMAFLAGFFEKRSLRRWKQWVQLFTTATLSNGSVAEEMEATHIFIFIQYLKKLVYAASRLLELQEG